MTAAQSDRLVSQVLIDDRRVEISQLVLDDQVVVDAVRTAFETGGPDEVNGLVCSALAIGVRAMEAPVATSLVSILQLTRRS